MISGQFIVLECGEEFDHYNFEKEISKEWKEKFKDEEENFEFGFESEI